MEQFMTYKGYPLVRRGSDIYFGYMCDDYVVMLQAERAENVDGVSVAKKVRFYQMSTDEKLNPIEAIVKTSERDSLYDALEVAATWLERANKKS
jgi:hypothetical protein